MTITHVTERPSSDDACSRHACVLELVVGASLVPDRDGLSAVLELIATAAREDTLSPETAFHLGQQLRLITGDAPADDDLEGHLLLQSLLSELTEYASLVDGVHVDDLQPLVDHLIAVGDLDEARRTLHLAEVARARVRVLEAPLAADLGAA